LNHPSPSRHKHFQTVSYTEHDAPEGKTAEQSRGRVEGVPDIVCEPEDKTVTSKHREAIDGFDRAGCRQD
jgi:hypothetical protein